MYIYDIDVFMTHDWCNVYTMNLSIRPDKIVYNFFFTDLLTYIVKGLLES